MCVCLLLCLFVCFSVRFSDKECSCHGHLFRDKNDFLVRSDVFGACCSFACFLVCWFLGLIVCFVCACVRVCGWQGGGQTNAVDGAAELQARRGTARLLHSSYT